MFKCAATYLVLDTTKDKNIVKKSEILTVCV